MRGTSAAVAIGLVLVSAVVRAQQSARARTAPSLSRVHRRAWPASRSTQAIARALEREPSLRAARTQIRRRAGLRMQAGLRPNPTLSFSQQEEPGGTDNQTRIELQWPLDLFARPAALPSPIANSRRRSRPSPIGSASLSADVRMEYGESPRPSARWPSWGSRSWPPTRQRTVVVSRRRRCGAAARTRLLRVEVQRLEAERRCRRAVVERRLCELKQLLGMPAGCAAEAAASARGTGWSRRRRRRRSRRPARDRGAARTCARPRRACGCADAQIDRAGREGRLDVSLFGTYMRMDAGFPSRASARPAISNAFEASVQLRGRPARRSRCRCEPQPGQVAAAQAERTGAEAQRDAARLTAQAEIAAARARDEHAQRPSCLRRRAIDARPAESGRRAPDIRPRARDSVRRPDRTASVPRIWSAPTPTSLREA